MKWAGKVVLGTLIVIAVIVVLISIGANEAEKDIEQEQAEFAITKAEFDQITTGMARKTVHAKLGEPEDTTETDIEGLGKSTCDYWPLKGGDPIIDQFQVCYNANNKVESKIS